MKLSKYFIFSLRESPRDAESKSHILMMKGGFIKKIASGIYSFTPAGLKIIRRIENIIRDEMEEIDCYEVQLPLLTPSELWQETGRWDMYGKELFRLKDRNDRQFCLAPTHEEIITDLVRYAVKSWKQLPLSLFQIGQKYRDEARPRFGVIRAREFIMKDAYSFDRTEEEAEKTYKKFFDAYCRIFEKLSLEVTPVEAAVGAIGGKFSHEFIFFTEYGEDRVISCNTCSFISKKEIAEFFLDTEKLIHEIKSKIESLPPRQKVYTPSTTTVESLGEYLKVPISRIIKSLFVVTQSGKYVLALVRGDRQISEDKLKSVLKEDFRLADESEVRRIFGAGKGFIGPLNFKGRIIVDKTVLTCTSGIGGADEDDYHFINVVPGRDFEISEICDIALAEDGDTCPRCKSGTLKERIGLELGHVFYLGQKYSTPMGLEFTDKDKSKKYVVMGCYGIGITRTAAAIFEKYGEGDKSVVFPYSVAPFKIYIIPVNVKDMEIMTAAYKIYSDLKDISVIDDRDDVSPGEKFADCDLWGAPIKIVVGKLLKEKGKVEVIFRLEGGKQEMYPQEVKSELYRIWPGI